jgi:CDP-glucose 4,6-dehydratase
MYEDNGISTRIRRDMRFDILNEKELQKNMDEIRPDFLFHLAAQPIVSQSYEEPVDTFLNNTIGYATVLNALRKYNGKIVSVLVSSDKCYQNKEWVWGYRENDELGGLDPYSASKAASEIVFKSFYHSYFRNNSEKKISSVRAGNVIGGGDWSRDRIIPDAMKAWSKGEKVVIRRPDSIRPWQFVLEPIFGYLLVAVKLSKHPELNGDCFNFGPDNLNSKTVIEIIEKLKQSFSGKEYEIVKDKNAFYETTLLKLNSDKAGQYLKWKPILDIEQCLDLIAKWYGSYSISGNQFNLTNEQITFFENKISKK